MSVISIKDMIEEDARPVAILLMKERRQKWMK